MEVSASCNACGSKSFMVPEEGEADQMVRCADCGIDVGNKQEIMDALKAKAEQEVQDMIKNTLGKSGAFKIR
ncbi:ECs_2282 family putative zinc-binding protein [Pseudomonas juntendi]|uniref:ECs_2282 family putative zinc-binding protein n=1 Tax=Pseudomonas juntendi TaxID=2666183 RepID=UPI003B94BB02